MHISLIVAVANNGCIGGNNQMLWHLPNDFKFFKNKTWGLPVVMGRKTYDSLGKPLAGRLNIVITNQANWQVEGVRVVHSLNEAIALAAEQDYKELMVIGGGSIYQQALPIAHQIYLTKVAANVSGDTFFPSLDAHIWNRTFEECFESDEKHAYAYCFETWQRR